MSQVDGFQFNKVEAAVKLLLAYKPWWERFASEVKVIPIEEMPMPGEPYAATMKLLPDMGMLVDVHFVRNSTVEDIAGKYEYELNKMIREYWSRLGFVHESERDEMRSACMGMEIASAINSDARRLNHVKPMDVPGLQGNFIRKWNIKSAPTLPEFTWTPEEYGLKAGMLAEDYYREMKKFSNQSGVGDSEDGDSSGSGESDGSDSSETDDMGLDGQQDPLQDMIGGESEPGTESESGEQQQSEGNESSEQNQESGKQGSDGTTEQESQDSSDSQDAEKSDDQSDSQSDDSQGGESEQDSQDEVDGGGTSSETDSNSPETSEEQSDEPSGGEEAKPDNDLLSGQNDETDKGGSKGLDTSSGSNTGESGDDSSESQQEGNQELHNLDRDDFTDDIPDEQEQVSERIKEETENSAVKSWEAETPDPEQYHDEYEPMEENEVESMVANMMDDIEDSGKGMTALKPGMSLMTLQRKFKETNRDKVLKKMGAEISSIMNRSASQGADDFTYSKRNPNQPAVGPIFMGMQSYIPTAVLIMDVSASMSAFFVNNFDKATETIKDFSSKYNANMYWATVDHSIQRQGTSSDLIRNPMEQFNKGFGVTDIAPVLKDIDDCKYTNHGRRIGKVDLVILMSDCLFDWNIFAGKKMKTPMIVASPYSPQEMQDKWRVGTIPEWVLNPRRVYQLYSPRSALSDLMADF